MRKIWPFLPRQAALRTLLVATMLTLATGCSGGAGSRSGAEQLVEVSLGAFRVPLAPNDAALRDVELPPRNGLLLRFELHALVPPKLEAAVLKRMDSHEVRVRNDVMNTCRSASLDELGEPSLTSLKLRLTKVVANHLGPSHVRRVVLSHVLLEPT